MELPLDEYSFMLAGMEWHIKKREEAMKDA